MQSGVAGFRSDTSLPLMRKTFIEALTSFCSEI